MQVARLLRNLSTLHLLLIALHMHVYCIILLLLGFFEVHVLNSKSDQTRNLCKFDASVYGRECYCSSSSHCHQSSPIHT